MSPSTTSTPFSTYSEYLESTIHEWPEYTQEYNPFVRYLNELYNKENYLTQTSAIIDISAGATTALSVQHFGLKPEKYGPSAYPWPIDFNCALDTVEDAIQTRVVLVDAGSKSLDPMLIDIIGLRFDIDPHFFWFHLQNPGFLEQTNQLRGLRLPASPIGAPFLHLGVQVNTSILILEKFAIGSSKVTLVAEERGQLTVVCAKSLVLALMDKFAIREKCNAADLVIDSPPGPRSFRPNTAQPSMSAHIAEPRAYELSLLSLSHGKLVAARQNPVLYLFPLVRLQIAWFGASILTPRAAYSRRNSKPWASSESDEDLHNLWENLRFTIETFETSILNFLHFVSQRSLSAASNGGIENDLAELLQYKDAALHDARRLESAIRDTLQLRVGMLALQESRKSIEQSKIAIEEGRRVKLLTVLAFVFVPVSLASSIFGMNVQQINHTGGNIWVFIVTAVLLTITAFCSWGFTSFFVKAQKRWRKRPSEQIPRKERLAQIWWLVRNGYIFWMISSGALLGLLTNGRNGYKSKRKGFEDGPYMHIKKHFSLDHAIYTPKSEGSSA